MRQFLEQNQFALVLHPNSVGRSTVGTSTSGRGDGVLHEYEPENISTVAASGCIETNFVYLRLHGSNDEHRGEYSEAQLEEIARQIHLWRGQGKEVFCFLLNDMNPTAISSSSPAKPTSAKPWDKYCAMPKNAKQLESLVYRLAQEDTPDAPKKPKRTLHNFFAKK